MKYLKQALLTIIGFCNDLPSRFDSGVHTLVEDVEHLAAALAHPFVVAWWSLGRLLRFMLGLPTRAMRAVVRLVLPVLRFPGRLARGIERAIQTLVRVILSPFAKLGVLMTAKTRRSNAKRTKAQALETVSITSDRQSHRELIILVLVGVVGLVAVLLLAPGLTAIHLSGHTMPIVPTASGSTPAFHLPASLTLDRVLGRITAFSPDQLLLLISATAVFISGVVFWVRMVRDSFQRDYPTATERTKWHLITALLFIPGAIAYFWKCYNRMTLRQFLGHHVLSIMVTSVAILVATSTFGSLWYFDKQAQAEVAATSGFKVPNLDLNPDSKAAILARTKYGAPLTAVVGGRSDPFTPLASQLPPSPPPAPPPTPAP